MDAPSLCKRERLITVRLGPQKGADFIEEATEACHCYLYFEPTHRLIAAFNAPMVLL
jgi:hypothetical protein